MGCDVTQPLLSDTSVPASPGLEIRIFRSYNRWMGMLDVIVVVGLVSVLYVYLKQSNGQ